jgi:hypothetical protein
MRTRRSLAGNGNGSKTTAFTTVKIAVLAPMPSASVAMAMTAKDGCFTKLRSANLTSWNKDSMVAAIAIRAPTRVPANAG